MPAFFVSIKMKEITLVRLTCIQTVPGFELDVAEAIKGGLCRNGGCLKYCLFKGFGTYDLIVMSQITSFDHDTLAQDIPPHITKITNFLSFLPYDGSKIFEKLDNSKFLGVSFIKLNPDHIVGLNSFYENQDIDRDFIILHSLGWNEIFFLSFSENAAAIYETILRALERNSRPPATPPILPFSVDLIIKIYTYIAINHNLIKSFSARSNDQSPGEVLKSVPFLNRKISGLTVTTSISINAGALSELSSYWPDDKFSHHYIAGKNDFKITPKSQTTWAEFIGFLLGFRLKHKQFVVSTETIFNFSNQGHCSLAQSSLLPSQELDNEQSSVGQYMEEFKASALEEKFKCKLPSWIHHHIASFMCLLQKPILDSAYIDMQNYLYRLEQLADSYHPKKHRDSPEKYLIEFVESLSSGIELRTLGVFDSLEHPSGRLLNRNGSVHRVLAAIRNIPARIIGRLEGDYNEWFGYINASGHKFQVIQDVIYVPEDAIFKPWLWWALYHEIGHILLAKNNNLLDIKHYSYTYFFANKTDGEHAWKAFFIEVIAEIIGYQLGFFNDYSLFCDVVWKHLKTISSIYQAEHPLRSYLVRTFVVGLYEKLFIHKSMSRDDFECKDNLYDLFMEHIKDVEEIINEKFPYAEAFVAINIENISEMYLILQWINTCLLNDEPKVEPLGSELLEDKNTVACFNQIKSGEIFWKEIKSPEAVLYLYIKDAYRKKTTDFSTTLAPSIIALIMSFWNDHERTVLNG